MTNTVIVEHVWTADAESKWFASLYPNGLTNYTDRINRHQRRCHIGRIKPTPMALELFGESIVTGIIVTSEGSMQNG